MAEKVEPDEILRILSLMSDLLLTLVRANKILAMETPGTFHRLGELELDSKLQEVITAMCEVLANDVGHDLLGPRLRSETELFREETPTLEGSMSTMKTIGEQMDALMMDFPTASLVLSLRHEAMVLDLLRDLKEQLTRELECFTPVRVMTTPMVAAEANTHLRERGWVLVEAEEEQDWEKTAPVWSGETLWDLQMVEP